MPIEVHAQVFNGAGVSGQHSKAGSSPGWGGSGGCRAPLPELVDRVAQLCDGLVELAGKAIRSDPPVSGILETDRDPSRCCCAP